MGKRGPKPKPTAIRILEGNPSRRELNANEPRVTVLASKPSAVAMDEIASTEWDRVMHAMPTGVYTAADEAVLADYSIAWSMLIGALLDIEKHGRLIEEPIIDKAGDIAGYKLKENPALRTWRAAHAILMQTTDRLGLSPGQRSRLGLNPDKKPPSKFGGLIAS
ncbi:MAG: P27 family phage terminase small subunit [Saprospiraceae bacterium]